MKNWIAEGKKEQAILIGNGDLSEFMYRRWQDFIGSTAVRELERGTSDMVIVGGGDNVQNPWIYLCFSKTHALSPTGQTRTFDESADGIVISEGIAALVLKRRADAERDGDRIYALIRGVGGSSDGRAKGLTAPRPEGQKRALDRAYAKAGFSPATVNLIEAHGTGTVESTGQRLKPSSRSLRLPVQHRIDAPSGP